VAGPSTNPGKYEPVRLIRKPVTSAEIPPRFPAKFWMPVHEPIFLGGAHCCKMTSMFPAERPTREAPHRKNRAVDAWSTHVAGISSKPIANDTVRRPLCVRV